MYEIELSRLYLPDPESPPGILEIDWRRAKNGSSVHSDTTKTYIPLSPLNLPSSRATADDTESFVTCSLASRVILHQPFHISYRLHLPSTAIDDLKAAPKLVSFQLESASDAFVFSGPRKVDRLLLLPSASLVNGDGQLLAQYTLLPMGRTGVVEIPRFRAWEILDSPAEEEERSRMAEIDQESPEPRMRELNVFRDNALAETVEAGFLERPLSLYVVPR